jgi:transposase
LVVLLARSRWCTFKKRLIFYSERGVASRDGRHIRDIQKAYRPDEIASWSWVTIRDVLAPEMDGWWPEEGASEHRVERLWARLKEWRAVATRYEKTAVSFTGVLCLAAALDWIK